MAKAKLLLRSKLAHPDGSVEDLVIWELPAATADRPHGVKYRCYYGSSDGRCIVRYDNESGKGDHVHLGGIEKPYSFESVERLLADFEQDVARARKARR